MEQVTVNTLFIVGVAATCGAVLMGGIGIVNRSDRAKYQAEWLKFGILLLLIIIMLGAGSFGKWGLLPVTLFLGYFAWQEIIQSVEKKYGEITNSMLLPILGILGILGGLGGTSFSVCLGVIIATWGVIALPIIISRKPPAMHGILAAGFGIIFITLPLAILLVLVDADYRIFTFLILLVMANDGFSAGFGRFLGKTPLCPAISPNKTWEGAIAGVLTCTVAGFFLHFTVPEWHLWQVLSISVGISLLSLTGDLITSSLKREAGIKDFGQVLFVTGGVLDKFDSLLFSLPMFYVVTMWIGG
ncbi:phosphatidate cytidylyltransferase [Microcoleus sp. B7-D4]|uniref:phosphatidate cytidylyltransferase n=1 Tax=Microcoleus sp. B7-D4 TaxID=2818696 RepID=UPI002FD55588